MPGASPYEHNEEESFLSSMMHFDVHPSVLFKLGQDLIKDDAQALAELVKNSYDADATTVRVTIDTHGWYDRATGKLVPEGEAVEAGAVQGRLSVTDDGDGMTVRAIQNGWLTVSNSEKRAFKEAGKTTTRGRTPLGDKGLGRLGVQRLGKLVQLETVSKSGEGDFIRHHLLIDWSRFDAANSLSSVPIQVTSNAVSGSTGTTVSVLGLSNHEYWEGRGELDLQRELASILSPYENAAGLRVFIKINNADLDVRKEARRLLTAAQNLFTFTYTNGQLSISAFIRSTELRGRSSEERRTYEQLIAPDNGFKFSEWLITARAGQAKGVGAELGDDNYFLRFSRTIALEDLVESGRQVADPGPFSGEISAFTYDRDEESALDSNSELREFAKRVSGIRVFRDGFGIRLDDDWLGLSAQQTEGRSFYGLRPKNTAGYVNLTAFANAALEETSSREAFTDTLAWRGFLGLMRAVVRFAAESRSFVRRNWTTYHREQLTPTELESSASPEEVTTHIVERTRQALDAQQNTHVVREIASELANVVSDLEASRDAASESVWPDPALAAATERAAKDIRTAQQQIFTALTQVDGILATLQDLGGAAALLREKIEVNEEQVDRAWESVALGLSAELLSHEVDQIAERLRGRSHQILDHLRTLTPIDQRTIGYAEHVRASSSELARQVSRLNPALRFRRETRSVLLVSTLVDAAVDYHGPRLEKRGINLHCEMRKDFAVRVNEGKITQVIDNLIRNSEYWVSREVQQSKLSPGEVLIVIDSPRISITDNGPGIDPRVEDSLFDAFVTTKPGQEGRGLGLFVVRQLLDSEGATVNLGTHRNLLNRRDTFEINLGSVLSAPSIKMDGDTDD